MAAKPLPPQKYLQECLAYDAKTGELVWKVRPREHFKNAHGWNLFNARYAGRPALRSVDAGYRRGAVDGVSYRAHRVIWKLRTGEDPVVVDHINNDPLDNRWCNLRAATHEGNSRNARLRKDSTSGLRGVHYSNVYKRWMAQIGVRGRNKYLGLYDTKEDAHEAYKRAARELHGEYANFGGRPDGR